MLDAVCKAEGCTRPRVTKGYCHGHYVHHEYRGLTTPMGKPKHFLTNVDLGEETATCALCGDNTPVLISYRRGTGERYARMCLSLYPGVQERALNRLAKSSYVLTATEREALLERQGGICANPSCDARDDDTSRWTRLATDHDHRSTDHAVRGLLCRRCNASIGMAPGDSLIGVLGLAVYLAAHERPRMAGVLDGLLNEVVASAGVAQV
ncbi:endonuclease domain-containing protein [Modestobacter sp. SSW1-42]|uniref:endonuclease domain-containing protein n=1 Tax=Modestobacter sp. SSW1-42 TaxID=596372 RepID=UPI0039865130